MRNFWKILLALFVVGNIFASNVHAEIKTYTGKGSYPITDEKTHGEVKELAKREAVRDALEKAGVAIFSQTKVENNMVTKDVIKVTAGSILKILDDKYKFIPVDEDDGIGMYNATVTISIDTDELNTKLNDFLEREYSEQSTLAKQYEELQKLNDANTKRIAELEKQLADKNSVKNIQQIKNEVAEIDSDTLYSQKIEAAEVAYHAFYSKDAINYATQAIEINQNNMLAYLIRGKSHSLATDYDKAIPDYDRAIQLNPNYAEGYYERGFAYYQLKNYYQAISDLTQSIHIDPNKSNSDAYLWRGNAYYQLKNYDKAIADLKRSLQFYPNDYLTISSIGNVHFALGQYQQAISDYTRALDIHPYSGVYYRRGLSYYYLKKYSQAIEDFTEYIRFISPNKSEVYYYRVFCYEALGYNSQALTDFTKARELRNKNF